MWENKQFIIIFIRGDENYKTENEILFGCQMRTRFMNETNNCALKKVWIEFL